MLGAAFLDVPGQAGGELAQDHAHGQQRAGLPPSAQPGERLLPALRGFAEAQCEVGGQGGFASTGRAQQHQARMLGKSFEDGNAAAFAPGVLAPSADGRSHFHLRLAQGGCQRLLLRNAEREFQVHVHASSSPEASVPSEPRPGQWRGA